MEGPSWLPGFRVCAWRVVSLDAVTMAALEGDVRTAHPGAAIVTSCQRLEAYGFEPCDCGAPVRLEGRAALERLAGVAAGLDSVVIGEAQIAGQVRAAFRGTRGPLRAAADVALAAARDVRRTFPQRSHAGHLLDRALTTARVQPVGRLLVLGTGAMGRLIAARGRELGFEVLLAGRRDPASGVPFVPLADVSGLGPVDIVAGCLGSGAGEVRLEALPPADLAVDLGTPRNFTGEPAGVVITLADLLADESRRPHAVALRSRLAQAVRAALDRRLARVTEDSHHPIGRFRLALERARQAALAAALAAQPTADRDALDRALHAALNRQFHDLTEQLRRERAYDRALRLAAALESWVTPAGAERPAAALR